MRDDAPSPPRLFRFLLTLVVRGPEAEFAVGDLLEDYRREVASRGRRAADRWYRLQTLSMAWHWLGREQGGGIMEAMTRDLRHAVRGLIRAPGYAVATLLTLGLGLGGAVAVLALGASVLQPLPFPEPGRLVAVQDVYRGRVRGAAPANYLDWRAQAASFQGMAAYATHARSLTFSATANRSVVADVSGNFFEVMGQHPVVGRGFDPALDLDFPSREAVLSHTLWMDALGGDPDVVGRTFQVDERTYEIAGVMPAGFAFPDPAVQVWVRAPQEVPEIQDFPGDLTQERQAWYFDVVGRLAAQASVAAASAEMDAIARRLEELHPDSNKETSVLVTPLLDETVASFRPTLLALALAVLLLLAAACTNVAHLTLARGTARRGAAAVRVALGATRGALLRGVLSEAWILGVGGSLLGAALASGAVRAVRGAFGTDLPRAQEVGIGPGVLTAAVLLGITSTTLITLLTHRSPGVTPGPKLATRGSSARARDGLVAAQVAAAVALCAGAMLVGRSLLNLSHVDPGFSSEGLATLRVALPDARLRPYDERIQAFREISERLAAIPGVTAVGLGTTGPLNTGPAASVRAVGRTDEEDAPNAAWQPVDPGYFAALGIPLVAGRGFTPQDVAGANVGIINETLARQRFPGEDPLGREISIGIDGHDRPITVVGVVGDTRTRGPARPAGPVLYRPMAQTGRRGFAANAAFFAVRAPDTPGLQATVRAVVQQTAPGLPVYDEATGDDLIRPFLQGSSGILLVLGVFAGVTLLLCAVGIYGVADYTVRQRRREIGIRLAVGADASRVMGEVMGRGVGRAALGVPVGLLLTWVLGRALRTLLFDVPALDVATYLLTSALVLVVAAAALWVPAHVAARTDASVTLRSD